MSDEPLWDWYRIDEEMEKHYKAHGNTYQFIWVRHLCRQILSDGEAERAKLLQQVDDKDKRIAKRDRRISDLESQLNFSQQTHDKQSQHLNEQFRRIAELEGQLAEREAYEVVAYLQNDNGEELHADEIAVTIGFENTATATFAWPEEGEYAVCRKQSEASDA